VPSFFMTARVLRARLSMLQCSTFESYALTELQGLEQAKPTQLSGGQQQRVALATCDRQTTSALVTR